MIAFILFIVGLVMLVKGADFLVEGASSLAARFNIPAIVIGLTVVAFGTSAPELVVSVSSALRGSTDISLGNVLGSNIFNILLILGISSVIFPLSVHKNTVWKEIPFSFLGAILMVILGLQLAIDTGQFDIAMVSSTEIEGVITRSGGLVLLSFFIVFLYYTFGIAKTTGVSEIEIKKMKPLQIATFIILGLLGLTIGSSLTVDNAITIARMFGMSDALIGFTLVAAGTSFPELFTSVAAARKKNVDIAVGNIVGSNIFNIFLILGVTAVIREVPIRGVQIMDIMVLWFTTLLLFVSIFVWKRHSIGKKEGMIMIIAYVLYTIFLIQRG